jgi:hypothetical protein
MGYLIVAVLLVGAVGLVNLVLILGILRRLREHTTALSRFTLTESDPIVARPGSVVGAFTATTTTAGRIGTADLTPGTLVGFFSPDCPACVGGLPDFLERARGLSAGGAEALAVVIGTEPDVTAIRDQLEPFARVVVEPAEGAVSRAFSVNGYPAYLRIGAGATIDASGFDLKMLDNAPVPA